MRNIRGLIVRTFDSACAAVTLAGWGVWFLGDHVVRLWQGRPSWMEETFKDLTFAIEPRDIEKPYDAPGSSAPDERVRGLEDPNRQGDAE